MLGDGGELGRGAPAAMVRRRGRPPQDAAEAVDEGVLLAAAFKAFAERGYDAATMRDLAKKLGVSHNLLNVRFGKKSELWKAAVTWRLKTASGFVTAAFDENADAEIRLRHLICLFCRWATQHSDIVGLTHFEGREASWRLEFIAARFILPFKARLDDLIEEVRRTRPVHAISTPALMAILVQGVGYYFDALPLQQSLGAVREVAPDQLERQADQMANFLLAGLLPG